MSCSASSVLALDTTPHNTKVAFIWISMREHRAVFMWGPMREHRAEGT